jgi:hypothetical protein
LPDSMPTALPSPPVVVVQARCLRHRVDATTLHPFEGAAGRFGALYSDALRMCDLNFESAVRRPRAP